MKLLEIGPEIESLLKSDSLFSKVAFDYLKASKLSFTLKELEDFMMSWSLENTTLPEQVNVYNGFGQPPLTLFNNGHFVVDLYFWQTLDTSLHSHSFSGAFQVLHGRSLHEVYKVIKKEEFYPDIFTSELKLEVKEMLNIGDIREIKRGLDFSHRVLHEINPTVTLCIRTINDKSPQWHHFDNGLSIQKIGPEASDIKRLSILDYIYTQDHSRAENYVATLLNTFSPSLTMNLFEQLSYDQMGLSEETVEYFFSKVVDKYGDKRWYQVYMESFN